MSFHAFCCFLLVIAGGLWLAWWVNRWETRNHIWSGDPDRTDYQARFLDDERGSK